MADTSNLSQFLTDVADAIKAKKGTTDKILAANFDTEIASIETGTDTSDATATVNDILKGKTAYSKDGKITGAIETEYIKSISMDSAVGDFTKIADISSDGKYCVSVKSSDKSTYNVWDVATGKQLGYQYGTNTTITSIRFSPVLEKDDEGHIIYTVFIAEQRHDRDYAGFTMFKFKVLGDGTDTDNKLTEVYREIVDGFQTNWPGSSVTIYPSLTRAGVCAVVMSSRQPNTKIVIFSLKDSTLTKYEYATSYTSGETVTSTGDWVGDTFYCKLDKWYKVVCTFTGNQLDSITGSVEKDTTDHIAYSTNYYYQNSILYTNSGSIEYDFTDELSDQVELVDVDDTLLMIEIKNSAVNTYTYNVTSKTLTTSGTYPTTLTSWYNVSGERAVDKCRVVLTISATATELILNLAPSEIPAKLTIGDNILYNTMGSTATASDLLKGKVAYSTTGKIVGTYVSNLTEEEYETAVTYTKLILGVSSLYSYLDYIQGSGTQYIKTDYVAKDNTTFEFKFESDTVSTNYETLFGSRTMIFERKESRTNAWQFTRGDYDTFSGKYSSIGEDWAQGQAYVVTIKGVDANNCEIYRDGTLKLSFDRPLRDGYPITLFSTYSGDRKSTIKLYYFKIYEDGVLVKNYMPAKRVSDNVVGLYDSVNDEFLTNNGTGEFLFS